MFLNSCVFLEECKKKYSTDEQLLDSRLTKKYKNLCSRTGSLWNHKRLYTTFLTHAVVLHKTCKQTLMFKIRGVLNCKSYRRLIQFIICFNLKYMQRWSYIFSTECCLPPGTVCDRCQQSSPIRGLSNLCAR